jgi:hypothetical protein
MTRAFHALERSLRDGPPDESGYVAGPLALGQGLGEEQATAFGTLERVRRGDLPRPPRTMRPSLDVVTVLALAVVVVFGGLGALGLLSRWGTGGLQTPYPSLPPSADGSGIVVPSMTETFTSTRNGFSVRYPAGWSVKAATTSWPADIFLPIGNSALDELKQPGEARLTAASQRLGPAQTEDEYLASFARPYQGSHPCGSAPSVSPRVPIDGHSGYLVAAGCPAPADSKFSVPDIQFQALVIADSRAYEITLDGNVDRAYFEAILATMRLDPSSAIDP